MDEKKPLKRNIFTWLLYDFWNSFFFSAIGTMFLGQWLIIDNHLPDIRYGASFSCATLLVFISSPILGARSDKIGRRMPFLKRSTIWLIIINWILAFVALSSLPNKIFIVLWLSIGVQYLYQTSLIFYNSLLKEVSTEKTRGGTAGLWEACGQFWWIIALLVFMPFVSGTLAFIGEPWRHQVFLPAFILSTLCMIPLLLRFKEHKKPIIQTTQNIYKKTWEGIKQLRTTQRNVWLYLLAFSLISDIVLTMILYMAVIMEVIYKVSDTYKTLILILFVSVGMPSAYIIGKLADKFGYKKVLAFTCVMLVITTATFFYSSAPWILYIVATIWWVSAGWYFGATRAFMTKLAPEWELGEYFWLYSTFHKAASITAPLIRWWITLRLIQYPIFKYQIAGTVMIILLIIWSILMMKVKEK